MLDIVKIHIPATLTIILCVILFAGWVFIAIAIPVGKLKNSVRWIIKEFKSGNIEGEIVDRFSDLFKKCRNSFLLSAWEELLSDIRYFEKLECILVKVQGVKLCCIVRPAFSHDQWLCKPLEYTYDIGYGIVQNYRRKHR